MEESLRSSKACERGIAALLIAFSIGLAAMPVAAADPEDPMPSAPGVPGLAEPGVPAVTACSAFADALDSASTFYGDFADSIEGVERPDYGDPTISTTNTSGRTALREAAASAMSAAGTPGLSPDIANPMRSWSVGATKLLLKMGLRTGGQSLNDTATRLNNDANNAQMACAAAGTHA
ncbi:hypothetical protein ACWDTP_23875 [Mycobacterium sp. NPDC003449]